MSHFSRRVPDNLKEFVSKMVFKNSFFQHHKMYQLDYLWATNQLLCNAKKELNNLEKQEIEVTNYISKMLLDDMGLTELDFEEVEYDPFRDYNKEQTELEKTKVKKLPNLVITKKTKYI